MKATTIYILCGWSAVILAVIGAYSQQQRARRVSIEGISLATWIMFTEMGVFWILYGCFAHSWQAIMGSLLILPLQIDVIMRLKFWDDWKTVVKSSVFIFVTCVLPALLWGWSGGIYGTAFAMVINRSPQLIKLIKVRDATGVSEAYWLNAVIASVLWVTYYLGSDYLAAGVATICSGTTNVFILYLAWLRHRQFEKMNQSN